MKPPLLSSKVEWLVTGIAAVSAVVLFHARGAVPRAGAVVEATITLGPDDRDGLHCAHPVDIEGTRCAYLDPETPAPPLKSESTLYPVLTTDRVMYLVAGLFDEPAVRTYLERTISRRRYTARCQLRLVRELTTYQTRFGSGSWESARVATWVAIPSACRVQ